MSKMDAHLEVSSTWKAQPPIEKNRTGKVCAKCSEPALRVCTKCRCTSYCDEDCQRKHWKMGHKQECSVDPLYFLPKLLERSLPEYRDFTKEEKTNRLSFTIQTGTAGLALDATRDIDTRDYYCKIITTTDPELEKHLQIEGLIGQPDKKILRRIGWDTLSAQAVTGFSAEDAEVFRIIFEDNFQNRPEMPINTIAHMLINLPDNVPPRGRFVVVKENRESTRIPFSKAELVDMMTWRVFCGENDMLSSRMYRENMRRREFQYQMKNYSKIYKNGLL